MQQLLASNKVLLRIEPSLLASTFVDARQWSAANEAGPNLEN